MIVSKKNDVDNQATTERKKYPIKKEKNTTFCLAEVDPLECPLCGNEMRVVSILKDDVVVEKILRHVGEWEEEESRGPADYFRSGVRDF